MGRKVGRKVSKIKPVRPFQLMFYPKDERNIGFLMEHADEIEASSEAAAVRVALDYLVRAVRRGEFTKEGFTE